MTFFTVVIRGLLRRPLRTGFTLAGISIGIAAVVALVGMARGFQKGWQLGLKARGTDIVVNNRTGGLTPKPFDASIRDQIAKLPKIAATCNILVEITSVENSDLMILSGREWGSFCWNNLELVSGRMPQDATEEAAVLGQTAADVLKKKVGDPIQIETKELRVVGIVKGGAIVEDGSVILSLPLLQAIMGTPNQINAIDVRVTPSTSQEQIRQLTQQIEQQFPEVRALTLSEHLSHSEGFRLVQAMSWGTSLLAIVVGVLGVMNTMLMSVFERTHEISVLLALGWTRRRIMRMILDEAAILGLLGGIVGVALGVIGVKILGASPAIRGLLKPDLSIALLTLSVLIAVAVGILSGLYPAWRSSRLNPESCLAERMRSAQFNRTVRNYSGHISSTVKLLFVSFITATVLAVNSARAAEPAAPVVSAAELAERLDSARLGNALIRTKLDIQSPGAGKRTLQLQIKERRTKGATDLLIKYFGLTSIRVKPSSCTRPRVPRKARSSFRSNQFARSRPRK